MYGNLARQLLSLEQTHNKNLKSGQEIIHRDLIIKCREGDRKAQNELYRLYSGAMYNISRRMMGDEDDARDLLQDVFVEAFTKLHKLKEISTFSAWIKRITINKCINAIKKKRILAVSINEEIDVMEEEDNHEDYIVTYEASKIMQAIDKISDGCRTVLNLYLFEGYDHKEIGQILAISESASKSQYSKAKAKVRKILEEQKLQGYGK